MSEFDAVREHRLGVVAVFVEKRHETAPKVNAVLSDYAAVIVGRMGIPYRERDVSVIAVIVDGTNEEIGAMTGRLGAIPGVDVKSALRKKGEEVSKGERERAEGSGRTKSEVRMQIPEVRIADEKESE